MKKLFLLAFFGIFATLVAYPTLSQNIVPNPPHNFQAIADPQSDGTFNVKIYWGINQAGPFPDGFHIYKTVFQNGMANTFLEAEVPSKQGQYQYYYILKTLQPGIYEFYATAFIGRAESKTSNIVRLELVPNVPFIKIVSQPPIYAYVGKKYVYEIKAVTNINCPIDVFEFEQEVPQGMTISQNGIIEWTPQTTGKFTVTVKVGTSCKINVEPAYQTFTIVVLENPNSDKPYVKIVSQPPKEGVVGVPIQYQVVAESNVRCPIKFKLYDGNMDGAVIDEETGLFTWTPTKSGQYAIVIFAYLSCDSLVATYQRICINVTESQYHHFCAHVVGTTTFQDDTPVPYGTVNAWKLDANDNQTNIVYKTFIKNGSFEFYLPEGTYVFEFFGDLFEHRFLVNATRFAEAAKVQLLCYNDQVKDYQIEMTLQKKPEPVNYTVSGFVKSAKDDSPILAVVEFIPVDFVFNSDKKQYYGTIYNFTTKTDQTGYYHITLPNTFSYIAHAIPAQSNIRYQDQYYYLSNSPYLADLIELDSNRTDINFLLEPVESTDNGFSGIVIDKDRNPIQSRVMAILLHPRNPSNNNIPNGVARVVETNENGQFSFVNLIPGDYILMSVPKDKQYAPGYYKFNDFATPKWKDATIIGVDQNMIQMIFEIKHRTRSGWKGLVKFEGQVVEATGNFKLSNEPQCCNTQAVQEALVCALDQNGEIIDYYVTDVAGRFVLETLPPTTFDIFISKPGYKEIQLTFNGDYETNFEINQTLYVEKEVSSAPEENKFTLYQTEQSLIINYDKSTSSNDIEVYDVYGNILSAKYSESSNSIILDISNLPTGVYFVKVKFGNELFTSKFVRIR
jgi:hypothetical protein